MPQGREPAGFSFRATPPAGGRLRKWQANPVDLRQIKDAVAIDPECGGGKHGARRWKKQPPAT